MRDLADCSPLAVHLAVCIFARLEMTSQQAVLACLGTELETGLVG